MESVFNNWSIVFFTGSNGWIWLSPWREKKQTYQHHHYALAQGQRARLHIPACPRVKITGSVINRRPSWQSPPLWLLWTWNSASSNYRSVYWWLSSRGFAWYGRPKPGCCVRLLEAGSGVWGRLESRLSINRTMISVRYADLTMSPSPACDGTEENCDGENVTTASFGSESAGK